MVGDVVGRDRDDTRLIEELDARKENALSIADLLFWNGRPQSHWERAGREFVILVF